MKIVINQLEKCGEDKDHKNEKIKKCEMDYVNIMLILKYK